MNIDFINYGAREKYAEPIVSYIKDDAFVMCRARVNGYSKQVIEHM